MKKLLLITSALIAVSGCSSKTDPSEANFGAAIDAYLVKWGQLCLGGQTWPQEQNELNRKMSLLLSKGNPTRLDALVAEGLASSSEVEKPINTYMGKPTGRTAKVTRYELTAKGKSFFQESAGSSSKSKSGEVTGELCYGRKSVDKVVKWDGPMKFGDYQEASVKYLYKIDGLADWAKSKVIQEAHPSIKSWVDGAGSSLQSHGVILTSEGWEARGIDRKW